jgi:hypothetical protein
MDEKLLRKLLHETKEHDWLEFKQSFELYQADGRLIDKQRDELLKDILGLANGNGHITRKTKYLIVGADDKKFDSYGLRVLHSVDYKVPSRSDIAKWLASACSAAVAGLDCELVPFQGVQLYIISIPPTFNLHETSRELVTPNGTFHKYTVFMRHDENTVPASVRDGITIQQLKQLHRQEIGRPPAAVTGAITGGVVGLFSAGIKVFAPTPAQPASTVIVILFTVILGVILGGVLGGAITGWAEMSYDVRYMSWRQRIFLLGCLIIAAVLYWVFAH